MNCATILEYVQNEVRVGSHTDYSGCSEYYDYITCPECNKKVEV